ncbi:FG-GAP-like repeat-containing protein [Dyadobacter flavalbus]|uniref:FG-GAP-like repeat-containing protein n=1 Tax=Dyadobacter flavalbus TaxID=2579942 RepID=UPI00137568F8|nr:FG-GAP-like repeat-containing protein [Dyadobacter flavalbus]
MKHTYKPVFVLIFAMAALAVIYAGKDYSFVKPVDPAPETNLKNKLFTKTLQVPEGANGKIQQELAKREYYISRDAAKGLLQSPNRRQNLRAYYKPGELTVQNRVDSAGHNFRLKLINKGIYADGRKFLQPQSDAWTESIENKLQIRHKGFVEEYINSKEGVRQNFIIYAAPEKTRELQVKLSVEGLKVKEAENNELHLFREATAVINKEQLIYNDLKCWDAKGNALDAMLAIANKDIVISVDVQNAVYPVTIDPIITNGDPTNANATLEVNQDEAGMGASVASAGDVNGDGFSDVIVGAPYYDINGLTNVGAAFLYYGSPMGITTTGLVTLHCNQSESLMGISVASAGDVNDDGFSDVIVGAPFYESDPVQHEEGAAFIYLGSASGLGNIPATTIEGNQTEAALGNSVAGAGDVNGDGFSDVIVGAYYYDIDQIDEGVAFIYHGSVIGVDIIADQTLQKDQASAEMGYSVAGAGDVDGDGYSDVIVGVPYYDNGETDEGAAIIYYGSAAGTQIIGTDILDSNEEGGNFATSVASCGDVNGDGFGDIIIGTQFAGNGNGVIVFVLGSALGCIPENAIFNYTAWYGASAGDVNGDGYGDIIIGAPRFDSNVNQDVDEGAAFVFYGSAGFGVNVQETPDITIQSNQNQAYMGNSVASAGDVNGDGFSDLIIGAYLYDNGSNDEGAAFIYHGSAAGTSLQATAKREGDQANAQTGSSVANAGDVNGDGYSDVIVGAPLYENAGLVNAGAIFVYQGSATGIGSVPAFTLKGDQAYALLGNSVSGAGDVNGDGYGDVVVGARLYDQTLADEGAVIIFYGSPSGLNAASRTMLYGNQLNASFGSSVAGSGDVNGDGYSDIIAAAPGFDNSPGNEGAAFVYHGSSSGIETAFTTVLKSDLPNTFIDLAVAPAGDVNGDAFGDVIVGARNYNDGAAFVYHGSKAGIDPEYNVSLPGDQVGVAMGSSVSGAGDVNGDGFSDVVVGAVNYNAGQGAAFVFHGSSDGINSTKAATLENAQAGSLMGSSVSGAGDVNGDGYSDVIVGSLWYDNGQSNEGAALIFHGSPEGVNTVYTTMLETDQADANIFSVAGTGDVNGDGYSDVITGSKFYNNSSGQTDAGAVFVYSGNNGSGNLRNNVRLYNSDLITNINKSQVNEHDFGAGLFAKSFLGKSKGKLVWETRKEGEGFSESPITNSTQLTDEQDSYADLGLSGTELKSVIIKKSNATKIRVRIKYDPVLALTGQVYGPWKYLSAYTAGSSYNASTPLPVELISFNADTVEKSVELHWATASEVNSKSFEIERSKNARDWNQIGSVPANVNVKSISHYSFTDVAVLSGTYYYRLKMTDQDGTYTYSRIQVVNVSSAELLVTLFPNPVSDKINIKYEGTDGIQEVQLRSENGKTVFQSGKALNQIDIKHLQPGLYILVITGQNGMKSTHKLIVKK